MNKKIITLGLCTVLALSALTGCKSNNTKDKTEYVISNDYVDVINYKNLETTEYVSNVTDEEINTYIAYVMNYTEDQKNESSEPSQLTINDLTDEMVKVLSNNDCSTIDEYKEYIKGVIEEQHSLSYQEETKEALFKKVVDGSNLKAFEQDKLDKYIEQSDEYYKDYAKYFNLSIEDFYKEHIPSSSTMTYEEFLKTQAKENLKKEYIIKAIASAEKIEITDEEIETEYNNYLDQKYFDSLDDAKKFINKEDVKTNIQYKKILDLIYSSAKFTKASNTKTEQSDAGGEITYVKEN